MAEPTPLITRLAARMEPAMSRAFLDAARLAIRTVDLEALAVALTSGGLSDIEAAAQLGKMASDLRLGYSPVLGRTFALGVATGADVARLTTFAYGFDLDNPMVIPWVRQHAADLVTEVGDGTRAAIRALVESGYAEGLAPSRLAYELREVVGLHSRQALAVSNFRQRLLGQGLDADVIDRRVGKYADAQLQWRAMNIARTETIGAASEGQEQLWAAAADAGDLDPERTLRVWSAHHDDRLDLEICEPLDGQETQLGQPFVHPDSGVEYMRPAAHPQCLPAGTMVSLVSPMTGQTERWYEGELCVIHTGSGRRLAVTPNHPMLTPRGWMPARLVHEAGHVVRYAAPASPAVSIEAFAASLPSSVRVAMVTTGPGDFHGDGGARGTAATVRTLIAPKGDAPGPRDAYLARDLLAGPVALDKVIRVESVPFHGLVYNLETADGWYLAEGLVTHNCRCAVVLSFTETRRAWLGWRTKYSEDQPRDEGGRWSDGGGGGGGESGGGSGYRRNDDGSWSAPDGSPAGADHETRARNLGIPPGWRDVRLSADPDADLQAIGKDSQGRTQRIYSAAHSERAAAEKFARLKEFSAELPKIRAAMSHDLANPNLSHREREAASALRLIDRTGFRPGSDAETGGKVKAYGATTLRAEHVDIDGDTATFRFTGKHGVQIEKTLRDKEVARDLAERKAHGGRLFDTSDAAVRDYLHARDGDFKVKDFRTWNGTSVALREIERTEPPKTKRAFVKAQAAVSRVVASHLGNTPAVARASYIDPVVWSRWKEVAL